MSDPEAYYQAAKYQVETFQEWAVVELMGHSIIAGRVSEQSIGGAPMVRVDVPAEDGEVGYTKLFSSGAIYAITPVTEAIAREHVRRIRPPVAVFDPPRQQQHPELTVTVHSAAGFEDDFDDGDI